jgi:cation diffusion facilitator CzcD-associated flavoprotein CzcO
MSGGTHTVLVVGAGLAGLGAVIRLRERGVEDVVVLERGDRVGGTWRDNTYPGAACDIPSLLYSFSFAPNPDWSRTYAGGEEILDYVEHLARSRDLYRHIRFGATVERLEWDDATGTWTAHVSGGEPVRARAVVMAAGPLANASLPDIPGLEDYTGITMHSARWDHDVDLDGLRVAVIGTGASAVQIVPRLAERVASLKVFQRTPGWVLPRLDQANSPATRAAFRAVPGLQRLARTALFGAHELVALGLVWPTPVTSVVETLARAWLRHEIPDAWDRRRLTPEFRAGCKRMLVSSEYLAALRSETTKLITWPIARLSPRGVRTADGIEHELDAIVFATGFDVSRTGTPFPVVGRGGRTLDERWAGGAHAYRSVTTAGFPNLFFTFGPNSGPGHHSALVYVEAQLEHIATAVRVIVDRDLRRLEVRADREEAENADLQRRLAATTWNSGCSSWYLTPEGHNATMYPGFATQYVRATRRVDLADYEMTAPAPCARFSGL